MTEQTTVQEAAEDLCKYVQGTLEKYDGWQQFDFFPEKFDLFWVCQLQKALTADSGQTPECGCESPEECEGDAACRKLDSTDKGKNLEQKL